MSLKRRCYDSYDEATNAFEILKNLDTYQTFFRYNEHPYSRDGYIIETDTGREIAWL